MKKFVVATTGEIPPGTRKLVHVKGRPIGVFNIGGEYFGLYDRCPHLGGSLCSGRLTGLVRSRVPGEYDFSRGGEILRCPWHGWEFDVRTGQSYCDPRRFRVKAYPAPVEAGAEVVKGPYVAETIKVAVESDYVVVEL
jgi:3-phenylpropionate/trans-cinnamate dioxygenase ferredoxin subunit